MIGQPFNLGDEVLALVTFSALLPEAIEVRVFPSSPVPIVIILLRYQLKTRLYIHILFYSISPLHYAPISSQSYRFAERTTSAICSQTLRYEHYLSPLNVRLSYNNILRHSI